MIIDEKDNRKNFSELKEGDVFKWIGVIYMKTETLYLADESINAVDLECGKLATVKEDEKVTPLSAVLTVERGEE
jgi:hypothetical protein